ncbi:hypothetical protein [Dactylosporangium sp. CA-092794]|uniref:hypothetical protein n=1 Tax=Dactylosporangium sp. CA-092794 TaxID=3239929 RepID=UPI003D90E4AD
MPSAEHESPVALAKLIPELLGWLLVNVFELKAPDHEHARSQDTDVRVLVPRTYRADGVVVFSDAADRPVMAVVLEVQRKREPAKWRIWKLYVAQLEAELGVDTALVVYCPDAAVARWYRQMVDPEQSSLPLRPYIFTTDDVPLAVDESTARANPAVAALVTICHGDRPEVDQMFPVLLEALRTLKPEQVIPYYDIVLAGLPPAARARWEAFMTTMVGEYHSELFRELAAQHEARGKAEGEGRAVLTVLGVRGIAVPDAIREQILGCTDLAQLETWLGRAVTAATAEDVVRG